MLSLKPHKKFQESVLLDSWCWQKATIAKELFKALQFREIIFRYVLFPCKRFFYSFKSYCFLIEFPILSGFISYDDDINDNVRLFVMKNDLLKYVTQIHTFVLFYFLLLHFNHNKLIKIRLLFVIFPLSFLHHF